MRGWKGLDLDGFRWWDRLMIRGGLILIALTALSVVVWAVFAPVDYLTRRSITCTVTKVDSWRQDGSSPSQALSIYSSDCPGLRKDGLGSKRKQDEIAARFQLGKPYTFTVGGLSYWISHDLGIGGMDITGPLPTEPG
ncbi:hypothetical protein [Streptomyces sp. NPDC058045]|uniref:hypothetical protein n=1 Tax=Streptomyces sp. NPDC058045 TaxID=3346311 RepID=UPI0036E3F3E0